MDPLACSRFETTPVEVDSSPTSGPGCKPKHHPTLWETFSLRRTSFISPWSSTSASPGPHRCEETPPGQDVDCDACRSGVLEDPPIQHMCLRLSMRSVEERNCKTIGCFVVYRLLDGSLPTAIVMGVEVKHILPAKRHNCGIDMS
jgi:hypothetical protein